MCPPEFLNALNDAEVSRRNLLKFGLGGAAATIAAMLVPQSAVAATRRTISYTNVTDLTHVLGPGSPLWPGAHPFEIGPVVTHRANGYYGNVVTYWEHSGTHIDAPIHFDPKGRFMDEVLPETLIAPAAVIDVKAAAAKDPAYRLTTDDILAWEQRYGRLPQGAAVLVNSGWGTRWVNPDQFRNMDGSKVMQFPGFSKEAADLFAEHRPRPLNRLPGALRLPADRPLGPGEPGESRCDPTRWRDTVCRRAQGRERLRRADPRAGAVVAPQ